MEQTYRNPKDKKWPPLSIPDIEDKLSVQEQGWHMQPSFESFIMNKVRMHTLQAVRMNTNTANNIVSGAHLADPSANSNQNEDPQDPVVEEQPNLGSVYFDEAMITFVGYTAEGEY